MADLYEELDAGIMLVGEGCMQLAAQKPDHELLQWLPLYWGVDGRWPLWEWSKKQRLIPRFWKGDVDWRELSNLELWAWWFSFYYDEIKTVLA